MTDFNFDQDVIDASHATPILVDFWASWCGPCKVLGPTLEKLAKEAADQWKLVKVDTEKYPQLAARFNIRGIPAVKLFSEGKEIAEFVGALPEPQILSWLGKYLPTAADKLIAEFKALSDQEKGKKQKLLQEIIELDENNWEARTRLALLIYVDEPKKAGELVKNIPPENPYATEAEAIFTLNRLHLNANKIQSNSNKTQAWNDYVAGMNALLANDFENALKKWIDVIIIDKSIDNDGARKACVAIFTILGQEHELTRKLHRSFTSACFS